METRTSFFREQSKAQLAFLQSCVSIFKNSARKDNPQRQAFLSLYEYFVQETKTMEVNQAIDTLLNVLIFEQETIFQLEYNSKIAKKQEYSFLLYKYQYGSGLYKEIEKILNQIFQNNLHDDDRFIRLFEFQKDVQDIVLERYFNEKKNNPSVWKNRKSLFDQIHSLLKGIAKRDEEWISELEKRRPLLNPLDENIQIFKEYQVMGSSLPMLIRKIVAWFAGQNPNRERLIQFEEYIYQTCKLLYKNHEEKFSTLNLDEQFSYAKNNPDYKRSVNIRAAVTLFSLMKITNAGNSLYASGSEVVKKCLTLINAKNIAEMKLGEKKRLLKEISIHIDNLKESNQWNEKFNDYAKQIEDMISGNIVIEKQSWCSSFFNYGIYSGINCGIGAAAVYVGGLSLATMTGSVPLYLASGAILRRVSDLLDNHIAPTVSEWVSDKATNAVTDTATGAVNLTTQVLSQKSQHDANRKITERWIDALLQAKVLPIEREERIRKVCGKSHPILPEPEAVTMAEESFVTVPQYLA